MFALLLLVAVRAEKPTQTVDVYDVDFFVVNRIVYRSRDAQGKLKTSERWYVSFWTVHWFPRNGTMRVPVVCNRGWTQGGNVSRASGGWAVDLPGGSVVFARECFLVESDFDFEKRNRQWYRPIR